MIAMSWKHRNVFIGCDAHSPKFWPQSFVHYINTYGHDKVIFGTDFPALGFERTRKEIDALGLAPGPKRKLLRDNVTRIYKLKGQSPDGAAGWVPRPTAPALRELAHETGLADERPREGEEVGGARAQDVFHGLRAAKSRAGGLVDAEAVRHGVDEPERHAEPERRSRWPSVRARTDRAARRTCGR